LKMRAFAEVRLFVEKKRVSYDPRAYEVFFIYVLAYI
jgi:hypothetical protein